MDKKVYESAVLLNAALDDEQIENLISRIKENINSNGGEIIEVENWGRKRLAYMVKKSKIGYYIFFRFNSPSNLITKLERFYSLEENILRYLTVYLDKDALEQLEFNKKQNSAETDEINNENRIVSDVEEETANESSEK